MNIVLHPASSTQFARLQKSLPHSLLIVGEKGMGARTVALELAKAYSRTPQILVPEKDSKPDPDGSIGVERIRELYESSRSRETGSRIIILQDAHTMTPQAQNAFLKLLEEPSTNTHFILTAHTSQPLLATVLSRVQVFELRPITTDQTSDLLDKLHVSDARVRAQLQFLAKGKPAELIHLAQEPKTLTARGTIISDARTLLQAQPYERLVICQAYKDDRAKALRLVDACLGLLRSGLAKSPTNTQLVTELERYLGAYERLEHNGNIRLSLARLVV